MLIGGRRTRLVKVGGAENRSRNERMIGYAACAWRERKARLLFHVDTPTVGFVQETCGSIEGLAPSATVLFSTSLISPRDDQGRRAFQGSSFYH